MTLLYLLMLFMHYNCKTANKKEFNRAIKELTKKIQSIDGYKIDTIGNTWIANSKDGTYRFEGGLIDKDNLDQYSIDIYSVIYDSSYFDKKITFTINFKYCTKSGIEQNSIHITSYASTFDDDFPVDMKNAAVVYKKLTYNIPYSEVTTFGNVFFQEHLVVIFKDESVKKYHIDNSDYKYYEE